MTTLTLELDNGKSTDVIVGAKTAPNIREALLTACKCLGYNGVTHGYLDSSTLYQNGVVKLKGAKAYIS